MRDFPTGKKWLPGTVTQVRGPLLFLVTLDDGRVLRRHINHIRELSPSATIPFLLTLHVTIGQLTPFKTIPLLP